MIQVLLPAKSGAQRPSESVNFIGTTSVLSAYLLKVFFKSPIQKGHLIKIWVGHFMDPSFEIEMERPIPKQPNANGSGVR